MTHHPPPEPDPDPAPGPDPELGPETDLNSGTGPASNPDQEPDPVPVPVPSLDSTSGPRFVNHPNIADDFNRKLNELTDLIISLPTHDIGSMIHTPNGSTEYTLYEHISELSERVVFLERAMRTIEAARTTVMGQIPQTLEQEETSPEVANTALLSVANQIAAATRSSDQTVSMKVNSSYEITDRFPELVDLMQTQALSFAHAKLIASHGSQIPDKVRDQYLEFATEVALSTTPGRLRRRLPKLVASLSPESVEVARQHASDERRAWVQDTGDGMAMLGVILPAPLALAAFDRITTIARQTMQATSDDTDTAADTAAPVQDDRTLGQARADIVAELLLASTTTRANKSTGDPYGFGIQGRVQVTVPVEALITEKSTDESTETSADLAGYGLINSRIAKYFAADAKSWNRVFIDNNGQVLSTDNYEPSAAIRRLIIARDGHCRFPGCLAPPSKCEIDHTLDWAKGGKTASNNLALLCKRHHALKHPSVHDTARWSVIQGAGGVLTWRAPDGTEYTDAPDPASEVRETVPSILPTKSPVHSPRKSRVVFRKVTNGEAGNDGTDDTPQDDTSQNGTDFNPWDERPF